MTKKEKALLLHLATKDNAEIEKLKKFLVARGFEIFDRSDEEANSSTADSEEHSELIREWLDVSSALLVVVDPDSETMEKPHSEEMQLAIQRGTKIVCIWPNDCKEENLPMGLRDCASATVHWDFESIAQAIEDPSFQSTRPDGKVSPRREDIPRYKCK